jgi:type VI secretion system protein VasD
MRFVKYAFFLPLLILMTACPKEPARVSMVMNAAANVNPDAQGKPLSVVVRVYQLKDKGRLESADYNAMLKSDKETLSDDLLDRQERVVQPGAQEILEIRANPMANYLGVIALFRSPQGDSWRRVIPISKSKTQKVAITLQEQTVVVSTAAK